MERIIEIKSLAVKALVGVSQEERATPQQLLLDLRFAAIKQPEDLFEKLDETVDYYVVSQRVEEICEQCPRHLIETLADDITKIILSEFNLSWIELRIKKFILPNAEYVAVNIRRE